MRTMYKYPLEITDEQRVKLRGSICTFMLQNGQLCAWAEHDDEREEFELVVYIVGTGHPSPPKRAVYHASVQQGPFVWHIYVGHTPEYMRLHPIPV